MFWNKPNNDDFCLHVDNQTARREAIRELFAKVSTFVAENLEPDDWSFLEISIWTDSGQIVVFPAKGVHDDATRTRFQGIFDELQSQYDRIDNECVYADGDFNDSLFDEQNAALEREWAKLIASEATLRRMQQKPLHFFSADEPSPFLIIERLTNDS